MSPPLPAENRPPSRQPGTHGCLFPERILPALPPLRRRPHISPAVPAVRKLPQSVPPRFRLLFLPEQGMSAPCHLRMHCRRSSLPAVPLNHSLLRQILPSPARKNSASREFRHPVARKEKLSAAASRLSIHIFFVILSVISVHSFFL